MIITNIKNLKKLSQVFLLVFITAGSLLITGTLYAQAISQVNSSVQKQRGQVVNEKIQFMTNQLQNQLGGSSNNNYSALPNDIALVNFGKLNPNLEQDLENIINSGQKIDAILYLIKDNKGNVYLDPTLIQFAITWTHQHNLKALAYFEILQDPATLQVHPDWAQMDFSGQRSTTFISPAIQEYQTYIKNLIDQVKYFSFDGICFSDVRFESQRYDFSPAIIQQYETSTNTSFSDIIYSLSQWLLYNYSTTISNSENFEPNLNASDFNLFQNEVSRTGINASIPIASFLEQERNRTILNQDVASWIKSTIFGNIPSSADLTSAFNTPLNASSMNAMSNLSLESFATEVNASGVHIGEFSIQKWIDWRATFMNEYATSLINRARETNPTLIVYLAQYSTNGYLGNVLYGNDLSMLSQQLNFTIDGNDPNLMEFNTGGKLVLGIDPIDPALKSWLISVISGGIALALTAWKASLFSFFEDLGLAAALYIGGYLMGALAAIPYGIGEAIAVAIAAIVGFVIAYVVPVVIWATVTWLISQVIKLIWSDPPETLTTNIQNAALDWYTTHTVTPEEAADHVVNAFANDFSSNLYSLLLSSMSDYIGSNWPGWLPKQIDIPYPSFHWVYVTFSWPFEWMNGWYFLPYIAYFTIDIFGAVVNLLSGLIYGIMSVFGVVDQLKATLTTQETKEEIANWLIENYGVYDYYVQTSTPIQSSENDANAVAVYSFGIHNTGNLVDQYTIALENLPDGVSASIGGITGYRCSIISAYPVKFEVFLGQTGSFNVYLSGLDNLVEGSYTFSLVVTSKETGTIKTIQVTLQIVTAFGADVQLSQSAISITPGDSQTITATVINIGQNAADFSISVTGMPTEWYSLSESETNLLQPGQSDSISIIIAPPRQYTVNSQDISVGVIASNIADNVFTRTPLDVKILPFHQISVNIVPFYTDIEPGAHTVFQVYSQNLGNTLDTIHCSIEGIDTAWYLFSANDMQYKPGEVKNELVTITPPRVYTTTPGVMDLQILGVSSEDPTAQAVQDFSINVLPFYEFTSSFNVVNNIGIPGTAIGFTVDVQNLGNINDVYNMQVEQLPLPPNFPASPLVISNSWGGISLNSLALNPGESEDVSLNYLVPSDWIGFYDAVYSFNLIVQSTGNNWLNSTFVSNITVETTQKSSLLWVQSALNSLTQEFNNLAGGSYLNAINNYLQNAQWDITKALSTLGDINKLVSLNFTIQAKQEINQVLNHLDLYRKQGRFIDDSYLTFENHVNSIKDTLSLMISKFTANPLINASLALGSMQLNVSRSLDPNITGDIIAHLKNAQDVIDNYQIIYTYSDMLAIVQQELDQVSSALQRDVQKGRIADATGTSFLQQIAQILSQI